MKKFISILLALVMCLSLVACGGGNDTPTIGQNEQLENNTPSTQETPTETTVPETTAEPEPVYETIEITMDNWQEYFEFTQAEGRWNEDDFGEAVVYLVDYYFTVKEEYQDKLNPDSPVDIAVICSHISSFYYFKADFTNRTFTIGEPVPEEKCDKSWDFMIGEQILDSQKMRGQSISLGNEYYNKKYPNECDTDDCPVFVVRDSFDVERIQGTISIRTN